MAMGIGGSGGMGWLGRSQSRINITPLIDVLLVLLIIFIMVTPALTKALQSEIPRKAEGSPPATANDSQLIVHLSADGRLHLNQETLSPEELPDRLTEIFMLRGGRRVVFLDADDRSAYGQVVEVMDLCRDGGAEVIGAVPDSCGL